MNGKDCKDLALKILKGNTLIAFVVILIFAAINAALGYLTAGIGAFLLSSILMISLYNVFINAYKGKGYEVKDMVDGIDKGITNRICLSVLKNIYLALWTLLFFIPGIVKSYSYFLAEFISRDNPDKTARECIDESRKLMDGHKADLFLFQLSFIGWIILGVFTFGILYIWLMPYMYQALIIYIDKNIYKLSVNKDEKEENSFDMTKEDVIDIDGTEEIKDYKYCTNCGTKIPNDSIYCGNCGTKVYKEE